MKVKMILLMVAGLLSAQAFGATVPLDGTWYTGSNNGTPYLSDTNSDSFVWGAEGSATAQTGTLWSYFDPMSLANDGDSITLSFTVTPAADVSEHSFRLGLFDSGDSKVTTNIPGSNTNSGFESSVGYYAQWNMGAAAHTGSDLYLRETGYAQVLSSKSDYGAIHLVNAEDTVSFEKDADYDIAFSVTRNSDSEYLVTSSIDGTDISSTTDIIAASSFDMVNILTPPTGIDSFEFSNFQVQQIPEPTTLLLLGLGSVGLLRRKR